MALISGPRLHAWSRRPSNLIRSTVWILAVALALSWLLWGLFGRAARQREPRFATAEEALGVVRHAPHYLGVDTRKHWLDPEDQSSPGPLVPGESEKEAGDMTGSEVILDWILIHVFARLDEAGLEESMGHLLRVYAAGRYGSAEGRPGQRALLEREGGAGRELAWEMAGDLAVLDKDLAGAERCYHKELERRPSSHAAGWLLRRALLQSREGHGEALRFARGEKELWHPAPPELRLAAAAELRDWTAMLSAALERDLAEARPALLVVALATAAVWFVIVAQFGGFAGGQWVLYGASLVLGMSSATATLVVSVVQSEIWKVGGDSEDLISGLIHFVAGVGLREEFLKLVFFLPLLPWLVLRGRAIDALVSAGLVGLGFALNENIGYFRGLGQSMAIGRLLTANILHVALTGTIGFSVYRVLWFRGRYWEEALSTFLLVVLAHGLYDSFIALPSLAAELGIVSSIILALVAWRYFELAGLHYRATGLRISLLAVFVLGTALVVGVTLNVVVFGSPPFPAALVFLADTVQLLPTAFVYIHRFRDR